jgi:hypothetical protein
MSTLDLVRAIAEHLGTGWHAGVDKDATTAGPHLTGPNRQKLAVTTGGTPARGRLIITGDLGDLLIYAPRTLPQSPSTSTPRPTGSPARSCADSYRTTRRL